MYSGRPATNTVATGAPLPLTRSSTARSARRPVSGWASRASACRCRRCPRRTASRRSRRSPRRTSSGRHPRRSPLNVTSLAPSAWRRPAEDRRAVREVGVGVAGALPGEAPAAGLVLQRVGALADHEHLGVRRQRQQALLVLEQHQRLAHGLARQRRLLQRRAVLPACSRADGLGWSIRPVRSFTRRIRVTASSMRAIGISPAAHLRDRVGDERRPVAWPAPSRRRCRR